MPPKRSSRPPTKPSRNRPLLAASEKPDRKTVLYGVDPNPKKVRQYWESQGYRGPRGDLRLRVLRNEVDRKPNILADEAAVFPVAESPKVGRPASWRHDDAGLHPVPVRATKADATPPAHYVHSFGRDQVAKYADQIEAAAKKHKVDPDLVKAIVYAENANGYHYGSVGEAAGRSTSILPMNINVETWQWLGVPAEEAKDPKGNIDLGVRLIQRLVERVPGASAAQIGTLYNNLKAEQVSDFGAQIQKSYDESLWEKRKAPDMGLLERSWFYFSGE